MKIQIFSDSLALPRLIPEKVYYEETWPAKLAQDHTVAQYSKGGGIIKEMFDQVFYYRMFCPDLVILQMGIVDCSPRPFTLFEEQFFKLNFFTKGCKAILKRLTKPWLRTVRKVAWTKPKDFRYYCEQFKIAYPDATVLALAILPSCEEYEKLAKGITKRISQYNAILKDVFDDNFIDTSAIPREGIMPDHHHLTAIGHQFIYELIQDRLNKILINK